MGLPVFASSAITRPSMVAIKILFAAPLAALHTETPLDVISENPLCKFTLGSNTHCSLPVAASIANTRSDGVLK